MENVYAYAAVICICSVIACITEMVCSDQRYAKMIRFIAGCFLLCAILQPLRSMGNLFGGIELTEHTYQADNTDMQELQQEFMENKLTELVQDKLWERQVQVENVAVSITVNQKQEMEGLICQVTLSEESAEDAASARQVIRECLGEDTRVILSHDHSVSSLS